MKKVLLTVMFVLVTASVAYAGVWDSLKGNFVSGAISVVFIALAGIMGKKWLKFKKPVQNVIKVYQEYAAAKKQQSAGGKDVTAKEWNGIFERMGEAIASIIAVIPARWLPSK